MPYAIVLYFDKPSENKIQAIWDTLAEAGISNELQTLNIRPHITLAIYDELRCQPCDNKLARYANQANHLHMAFSHIGAFLQPERVLFISPTPTKELLDFHASVHDHLAEDTQNPWDMYLPGNWVPHCTLALDLEEEQLNKAMSICTNIQLPIEMHANQIGAVEFLPMKGLYEYDLQEI
jgi:2'-5' RNA ligase